MAGGGYKLVEKLHSKIFDKFSTWNQIPTVVPEVEKAEKRDYENEILEMSFELGLREVSS